ncbi:hypothetical protein SUGI_0239310 [Cryptomeria japonica]|uniref:large ribosomal subunit protein bL12c n=1 Tax=Cryptomeria japonica TaxID=3369 RepID=UPI002408942B|nr:large ribosomal subunit protein bL12c [Cryptomeria japonica]GLJ14757.1 hypothetical protein SUGI_0239310 [Cryptomeria japonica]
MNNNTLLRNLANRVNCRASLWVWSLYNESPCFQAVGFSSTASKANPEKQVDGNINNKQKLERIADELMNLNVLERHDYKILFRLKLGLDRFASPVGGMVIPGAPAADGAAPEKKVAEKSTFDVKLEKYEANAKIKIIKEVRGFTDLGLKEAKDLVEKIPAVLKKGLTKEEATKIVEKLKELGATAVME